MTALYNKLRLARDRIVNPANWRRGGKDNPDDDCSTPPYCAGSALWNPRGGKKDGDAETEAIRCVLKAAGLPIPDPPDSDVEIDALVDWNDSSDHATVLAAFDRALADCQP